jgi:hypothetical protein
VLASIDFKVIRRYRSRINRSKVKGVANALFYSVFSKSIA